MGKNIENPVIDKGDITNNRDNNDAYSLFVYAIRSQITKDYYLRRLRLFFDYISLLPGHDMSKRCNMFAQKGVKDPNWTFTKIVQFLQFQKELKRDNKSDILIQDRTV